MRTAEPSLRLEKLPTSSCGRPRASARLHHRRLYQQPHLSAVLGATQVPHDEAGRPHACPTLHLCFSSRRAPLCSHQPSSPFPSPFPLPFPPSLASLSSPPPTLARVITHSLAHWIVVSCTPQVQLQSNTSLTTVQSQSHISRSTVSKQSETGRTEITALPHALLSSCLRLVSRSRHIL